MSAAPALPPRQGRGSALPPPPQTHQMYDQEADEEDHYNYDGFEDDEFADGPEEDYEEPTTQMQAPPQRREVPLPGAQGLPRRAVPPPPIIAPSTSHEDVSSGEEYTEIPEDHSTTLFKQATKTSRPPHGARREPPPPPQPEQEEYEVPDVPVTEEEYTEPEVPPQPQRSLPPVPSALPSLQSPQSEDVYEEAEDTRTHGDAGGDVYQEVDEVTSTVTRTIPHPPPQLPSLPQNRAPQNRAPPMPPRENTSLAEPRQSQQGSKIVDINSVAVRDIKNRLRPRVPEEFRKNENNNEPPTEEIDFSALTVKERMALLKNKGGMFAGNSGASGSNKKVTQSPRKPERQKPPEVPSPARPLPQPPSDFSPDPPSNKGPPRSFSEREPPREPPPPVGATGTNRPLPVVPPDVELEGLYSYSWYFGNLDRNDAVSKIENIGQNGCYLVRKSQRGGVANPYTLSVYYKNKVWNLHIRKRTDQKFALGNEKANEAVFNTVPELVDYHMKNVIVLANKDEIGGEVKLSTNPPK